MTRVPAPQRRKLNDVVEFANVMYVGPQGYGKTTAMAGLARCGNMVYVDLESGLKAKALKAHGIPTDNIEVVQPRNFDEFEALYWDMKLWVQNGEIIGAAFDSLTEMQARLVKLAVLERVAKEQRKDHSKQNPELLNRHFTAQNDYGTWTNQARDLFRDFRDLPIHTAYGTLQRREVGSDGVKLVPQLTQAIRSDILGYVDMVAHMVTAENPHSPNPDGIEYLGIMRGVSVYSGKDRFGVTPRVLANPSFDRLIALLNDGLNLETDADQIAYLRRMAEKTGTTVPSVADSTDNKPAEAEADEDSEHEETNA